MLEVFHPELHEFAPVGRSLVEHATPGTRPRLAGHVSLVGQTRGAEHVAALRARPLAGDEGELVAAHVAVHGVAGGGWASLGLIWRSVIVRRSTTHRSCSGLKLITK